MLHNKCSREIVSFWMGRKDGFILLKNVCARLTLLCYKISAHTHTLAYICTKFCDNLFSVCVSVFLSLPMYLVGKSNIVGIIYGFTWHLGSDYQSYVNQMCQFGYKWELKSVYAGIRNGFLEMYNINIIRYAPHTFSLCVCVSLPHSHPLSDRPLFSFTLSSRKCVLFLLMLLFRVAWPEKL